MLRIYDDLESHNRLRIRRLSAVLLFAGGLMAGSYLTQTDSGVAQAQPPAASPAPELNAPALKLDERLRTPVYPAASSPLAINLAFPPTAEVLMVSVRSDTKRSR